MSAGIRIHRVRPDDGERYREVRLAALRDSPFAFASTYEEEAVLPDAQWREWASQRAGGDSNAVFFALDSSDRPIGIVAVFYPETRPADAELVSMWVAPEARGGGVGGRLVDTAIRWATETRAESVWLWVTRDNDAARQLYQRKGFALTGEYTSLPSDPCALEDRMVLRL